MEKEVYVTTSQATKMLGISTWKMAQLIRDGILKWKPDPLNKRVKLILKEDVERLIAQRPNVLEEEGNRAALAFAC